MEGLALSLTGLAGCPLALVHAPLAPLSNSAPAAEEEEPGEEQLLPARLSPSLAHGLGALRRVRALGGTRAPPFVAWLGGDGRLTLACAKPALAPLFKLLLGRQKELGLVLRGVKEHVQLPPLPPSELQQAAAEWALAALTARGWWQLPGGPLLSTDLLAAANGQTHTCGRLALQVEVQQPNSVVLLLKPEQVRFRHIAAARPSGDQPAPSLPALRQRLTGSLCTVLLPELRQGLVDGVQPASPQALATLRPLWQSYGLPLPDLLPFLVMVRFDCDEDAPAFPYPPCCVLSQQGLDVAASKLTAPPVAALLARLADEVTAAAGASSFWGGNGLALGPAHVWHPGGLPQQPLKGAQAQQLQGDAAPQSTFQSAFQSARHPHVLAAAGLPPLPLGRAIDLAALAAGAAAAAAEGGLAAGGSSSTVRQKKAHARPDPQLQAYLQQLKAQQAEQGQRQAAPARQPAAPPAPKPGSVLASLLARPPGAKPVAPVFPKRKAATAAGTPAKAPAVGKKRAPAAGTKAAAAKRPKAATSATAPSGLLPVCASATAGDTAASAGAEGGSKAAGAAAPKKQAAARVPKAATAALPAGAPAAEGSAAAAGTAAAAAAAGTAPSGPAAAGAGAGAAAPKPPRPKTAELDAVALTSRARELLAGGKLGSLTIPEMKCVLKSLGRPVGGKKAELEERLREALVPAAAGLALAG